MTKTKRLKKTYSFDTSERKTVPVTLKGADGKNHPYLLTEMDGKLLSEWRAYQQLETKEQTQYHATLIHKCLSPLTPASPKTDVSSKFDVDQIAAWPSSVQLQLFELCSYLNGFLKDEDEEGEAKKE